VAPFGARATAARPGKVPALAKGRSGTRTPSRLPSVGLMSPFPDKEARVGILVGLKLLRPLTVIVTAQDEASHTIIDDGRIKLIDNSCQ
jgi:hypothetical protein